MIEIDIDQKIDSLPNGIHNLTNAEYHALDGLSSTGFASMEKGQKVFERRSDFPWSSSSFTYGDLLHTAILEPHEMENRYIEADTIGSDTVSARRLQEKNPDVTVVGKGSIDPVIKLSKAVRGIYPEIFDDPETLYETSFIFNSSHTGLTHKARPDILYKREDGKYIIFDLKSTKHGNRKGFEHSISDFNYHLSAAWYIDVLTDLGYQVEGFGWICVPNSGKQEPYACITSRQDVERGRELYNEYINDYLEYKNNGLDPKKYVTVYTKAERKKMQLLSEAGG